MSTARKRLLQKKSGLKKKSRSKSGFKIGFVIFSVIGFILIFSPFLGRYLNTKNVESERQKQDKIKISSQTESSTASATLANEPIQIEKSLLSVITPNKSPERIIIPDLSLDVAIIEAPVIDGYWKISENTASHGVGSAYPGENGNIVIFAHARNKLFEPLRRIKKGSLIYILTGDSWHRYISLDSKLVEPNNVEVIKKTDTEILTLFTCSGFMDNKRLIVNAFPSP